MLIIKLQYQVKPWLNSGDFVFAILYAQYAKNINESRHIVPNPYFDYQNKSIHFAFLLSLFYLYDTKYLVCQRCWAEKKILFKIRNAEN